MRFPAAITHTSFALCLVLAPGLSADDDLPSWDSRESANEPIAKAQPPAPKPKPKPPAPKRETIIYGEDNTTAHKFSLSTKSRALIEEAKREAAANKAEKSAVAKKTVKPPTQPAEAPKPDPTPVVATKSTPEPKAEPETEIVERKVKVIHVKSHQKSLSSKSKPLVNQKVTHRVIREEVPVEKEEDRLPLPVATTQSQPEPRRLPEPEAPKPAAAPAPAQRSLATYTVRKGDTLWGISRKFKTSIVAIKEANGMENDLIHPGKKLRIPSKSAPVQKVAKVTPTSPEAPAANKETVRKASAAQVAQKSSSAPAKKGTLSKNAMVRKAQLKLRDVAISLARHDIGYNKKWRPPGEKEPWVMDCSNTSRYLLQQAAGLEIPRTASSQYWVLDNKKLVWRVPKDNEGRPSKAYLERNLQVGDLLFWEHTYKPVREPPVTHVTVFLGKNKKGEWIMAGSQSRQRGELTDDIGGPDLYVFNPHAPSGGYSTMLGMHKVKGRFVGFGRPLALLGKMKDIKVSSR